MITCPVWVCKSCQSLGWLPSCLSNLIASFSDPFKYGTTRFSDIQSRSSCWWWNLLCKVSNREERSCRVHTMQYIRLISNSVSVVSLFPLDFELGCIHPFSRIFSVAVLYYPWSSTHVILLNFHSKEWIHWTEWNTWVSCFFKSLIMCNLYGFFICSSSPNVKTIIVFRPLESVLHHNAVELLVHQV